MGYDEKAEIPAGTQLSVQEIPVEDCIEDAEAVLGGRIALARFFDITLVADGQEVQPHAPVTVSVMLADETEGEVQALHFGDAGVEVLEAREHEDEVVFETSGFSVFGVIYTVDFSYSVNGRTYEFSLPGGETIALSDLAETLGMIDGTDYADVNAFIADIENVVFTDPTLVQVARNEAGDDWTLTSLQPFNTDEALTITMKNGDVVKVRVTDVQIPTDFTNAVDLKPYVDSATLVVDGQEISSPWTVTDGTKYNLRLTFKEIEEVRQFPDDNRPMIYHLPDGVKLGDQRVQKSFSINSPDGSDSNKIDGNVWVYDPETNTIAIVFNTDNPNFDKFPAAENANFFIDLEAEIEVEKEEIEFNQDVTVKVIDGTNHDFTVSKVGTYNHINGTIDYVIKVKSTGLNENVVVTDAITGSTLTLIQPISISGNKTSDSSAINTTYTADDKGFETTIPKMSDGEIITIRYSAQIDYSKLGSESTTATETGNNVTVDSDKAEPDTINNVVNTIDYEKTTKSAGAVTKEGDNRTIPWTITVNEDPKKSMGGKTVTDTIGKNSQSFMKYSGTGIQVVVTNAAGTHVRTDNISWDELTQHSDSSWTYTIPAEDTEPYKYVITYTTEADMSDRIDPDGADVTNRVKTPEDSDNGTQHVDSGDNTVDIQKKMIETTQLTINWEASFTVPKTGLSEAVLTDTYPSMVLYQDTLNGSITVTGTDPDTERYTIDTSHTGYATITFEKKVDEKWVPGLHGADSERTIFVELTTNNDQDWVTQGADFSYLRSHTNTVSLKVGDESIEANASGSPTKQTFSKTGTQVGTVIIDGVELPVFKYTLRLTGVSSDTVTITDTYDKHLRFYSVTEAPHPTGYSSSDQKLKGGDIGILGFYASDRSGRVDPIQDADNNTLTFDNVKVVKDGEDYYPVYELVYYMVVKDKANVKDVAQTSLSNNCYYKFDNQAKWVNANLDAKASVNYLAYPMSKKAAGNASQANDFTDTFTIVLNPNAIRLNNGEDIKVEDTLTNLNVDFSTMNIVLEPARDDYDVEWTFNDNVGTFWIPDETKVIITYHARAVGEAGTNVSYSNTARMLSYRATDGSTVKIIGSGGGTYDPSYRVKLYKYENNTMNVPLAGASFQLYDADQNVMTYQKDSDSYDESLPISHTNHKIGDPVTFTTGDNGYAEIRLYGDDQDGLALGWMTDYYLYETVVPDGYEKEDIYWHFKIGATDSSDLVNHKYTFHNGGIVKVSNTKKENALVLKKAFSGTELTEAQKRNITFTVVGTNAEKVVFRRSITYAEFTGGQYRFKKLPAGNYTIRDEYNFVRGYRAWR